MHTYIRYSLFLTWCSRVLTRKWIAIFLVQSTETRVLDIFTCVFVTYICEYKILASLLTWISSTLRALLTRYEFTRDFRFHYSARSKYLAGMVIIIMKLLLLNRVERVWLLTLLCVRWITHITFTAELSGTLHNASE